VQKFKVQLAIMGFFFKVQIETSDYNIACLLGPQLANAMNAVYIGVEYAD
jgi:hypothetical protein